MKRYFLSQKEKFGLIYVFTFFILLLAIYFPSFSYPPLSDCWTLFYNFHHLNEFPKLPGTNQWLHCLNWDPNEQMNYRPLFGLFYYVLHLLFGSNFIFFNIFNFLFYFFSVFLLYKFASNFSKNRGLTALFVGFFAFLFCHSDIVLWSFHMHIIAGFCMFLLGFMSYIRFLKTGRLLLLFVVISLFLIGMLCYETFFLWPFAIIILSCIRHLKAERGPRKERIIRSNWSILGIIYAVYFLFYFFTRSLGTYGNPTHNFFDFFKLKNFISAGFLVLFNIIYNIVINIYPLLPFPLKVTENIYMAGPIVNYIAKDHKEIVFIGGALIGILLFCWFIYLYRKKYFEEMKTIGFLLFLILLETYTLFFVRLVITPFEYGLTEFRYQYVPNAFVVLIILFIADRFLKLSKNRKRIIFFVLTLLFVSNIYCVRRAMSIYDNHFANLRKMLSNIKSGICNGSINKDDRLYIDDDIPDYLPSLCWNIGMGERFIKRGNYQWMFLRKEIKYFSGSLEDAAWLIDKEEFEVIKKSSKNISKKVKK